MSPKPLNFGLVGCGLISQFHGKAIRAAAGAELIAATDPQPDRLEKFCADFGCEAAASFEALIADPRLDVVNVLTPNAMHAEFAIPAMEAGKHVVIEKPLEISVERVDRLLAAAAKARVVVAPIFQARFGAGAQRIKAAMDEGRFGRLVLASAYVKWFRTRDYYHGWKGTLALDGGGATMNQAIHGLDLLQWFAGMPAEVCGHTTRRVHTGIESEDTAAAVLRYPDGAFGTIEATTAAFPGWSRRIELCGENGSVRLEDDTIVQWEFREPRPEDDAIRRAAADTAMGSGASDPKAISHQGHMRQIQDLANHLRHGAPLGLTGPDARNAVSLVCALYESAHTGHPVAPA